MADSFEEQGWVRLGVTAALTTEYTANQRHFLTLLAETLERALPGEVETKTKGFFGGKHIVGLSITIGDDRYGIDDPGKGGLKATKTHVVRGIALKSEPISIEQCLAAIGDGLEHRMRESESARNALSAMLGLS